jgi:hypothetical protein
MVGSLLITESDLLQGANLEVFTEEIESKKFQG